MEEKEQIAKQLTNITQKHRKMSRARGDSLLQLTEIHETLIRRASEQAAFARTVEIFIIVQYHKSAMDGNNCALLRGEFSKLMITMSSERSCQDRTSDWNKSFQICRNFGDQAQHKTNEDNKLKREAHAEKFVESVGAGG